MLVHFLFATLTNVSSLIHLLRFDLLMRKYKITESASSMFLPFCQKKISTYVETPSKLAAKCVTQGRIIFVKCLF